MYDIIIVGAGPAGLSCALYALRANKKVLVLEAKSYGGQIVNAHKVENYPGIPMISGFDYATNLYNQVKELGATIKFEQVIEVTEDKKVKTTKDTYQAKAIILATGAQRRKLNIENEEEYIGKGISYCATCDGNFYKNKTVAVIGGGNTALEEATYLSNIADKVYLIHRRDTFKGEEKVLDELKEKANVEILYNTKVYKIKGQEVLESIVVKVQDTDKELKIDGLFVAIGQNPQNEVFAPLIELDSYGYIASKDGVHTNIKGIYVAGDARVKHLRQLTTATSDGAIAATTAIEELE